ncbi:Uncharacterised protein [Vibrio cholerae]|nr:Uncharacterised protein [Vibrio cholerae]
MHGCSPMRPAILTDVAENEEIKSSFLPSENIRVNNPFH